jgi:hypothetical protein
MTYVLCLKYLGNNMARRLVASEGLSIAWARRSQSSKLMKARHLQRHVAHEVASSRLITYEGASLTKQELTKARQLRSSTDRIGRAGS